MICTREKVSMRTFFESENRIDAEAQLRTRHRNMEARLEKNIKNHQKKKEYRKIIFRKKMLRTWRTFSMFSSLGACQAWIVSSLPAPWARTASSNSLRRYCYNSAIKVNQLWKLEYSGNIKVYFSLLLQVSIFKLHY